jgi:hypothetical protein
MIHDATVEVTCEGKKCKESVFVPLVAGARDTYLADDNDIERDLERDHDWIVKDGHHFCSPECSKKA